MTLGISAISYATGAEQIDNLAQGEAFGRSADFINNKIGFTKLGRLAEGQGSADLALEAFRLLISANKVDTDNIDCLIVVTQNPSSGGLPHMSAVLHGLFGLKPNVAAFDISLGCSGYVYALNTIIPFMTAAGLKNGVLVTVDPYSPILDKSDINTCLLFGDAATCTLITDFPKYLLGKSLFATEGSKYKALHRQDNLLSMDGRDIFNFSLTNVPAQIQQ